jgi:hypothetical protein
MRMIRKGIGPISILLALWMLLPETVAPKEIDSLPSAQSHQPSDWFKGHRFQYLYFRSLRSGQEMLGLLDRRDHLAGSFIDAARYNTIRGLFREYTSISQRHAYYDLISFLIEFHGNTPKPIRAVRFFHAATTVTTGLQLGAVEALAKFDRLLPMRWLADSCGGITEPTRDLLSRINELLFEKNMFVIRQLIYEWKEPKDPRANRATRAISAWEFDLAMVEFEQESVEQFLKATNPSEQIREELRGIEKNCIFRVVPNINVQEQVNPWLKKAGIEEADFNNIEHRKAIGKAWVTIYHKRGLNDYLVAVGKSGGGTPWP